MVITDSALFIRKENDYPFMELGRLKKALKVSSFSIRPEIY